MGWIVLISSSLFVCMVAFAATSSSRFGREPKNRPEMPSRFLISSTLESFVKIFAQKNSRVSLSCELLLEGMTVFLSWANESCFRTKKQISPQYSQLLAVLKRSWQLDDLARKFSRLFRAALHASTQVGYTQSNFIRDFSWQKVYLKKQTTEK